MLTVRKPSEMGSYIKNTERRHLKIDTAEFYVKEFRLVFESSMKSLCRLEEFLFTLQDSFYIDEQKFATILVSVTESLTNLIVYGNKLNSDKKVFMFVRYTQESFTFTIEDEGSGFDFNNIEDPTGVTKPEKRCGRGIYIMKKLSDSFQYSENGKRLSMLFFLNKLMSRLLLYF